MTRKILFLFFLLLPGILVHALDGIAALNAAVRTAGPGDTLVLANGTYRDAEILLVGKGEPSRPIVVRAETPGGVVISGASVLRIAGVGIELQGFHFTNGFA